MLSEVEFSLHDGSAPKSLLLLSAWTAQETFCRSLNNSTGIRMESGEGESEIMPQSPGLVKKIFCDTI